MSFDREQFRSSDDVGAAQRGELAFIAAEEYAKNRPPTVRVASSDGCVASTIFFAHDFGREPQGTFHAAQSFDAVVVMSFQLPHLVGQVRVADHSNDVVFEVGKENVVVRTR